MNDPQVLFRETQRFRQPWLWLVVACATIPVLALLVVVEPESWTARAVVLAALLVAPVLLALLTLRTEVRPDGLHVWFRPLLRHRHLRPEEISEVTARSYRPIAEYGGWGVRRGPGGTAYNVSGDRGVQLVLASGKRLLIGSRRADELAAAIETVRRSRAR